MTPQAIESQLVPIREVELGIRENLKAVLGLDQVIELNEVVEASVGGRSRKTAEAAQVRTAQVADKRKAASGTVEVKVTRVAAAAVAALRVVRKGLDSEIAVDRLQLRTVRPVLEACSKTAIMITQLHRQVEIHR